MEGGLLNEAVSPELLEAVEAWWEAKWSQAFQNKLPDSAFLWIHPDYKSGKSTDKSLRKLPYKDENGNVDLSHVRNALARLEQADDIPDDAKKKIRAKLEKILGAESKKKKTTESAGLKPAATGAKPRVDDFIIESTFADAALVEGKEHTFDVTLIEPGWSKNGRHYSREVLGEASARGVFEGQRAYVDHPPRALAAEPRSVRDLAGEYTNFTLSESGAPRAELKLFKPASDWLEPLIKEAGHLIGVSIRARGDFGPGEAEGRRGTVVERIDEVVSVDVVAEPAAGGTFDAMVEALYEGKLADKIDAEKRKEEYWKLTSALRQIFDDVVDGRVPAADLESALGDFVGSMKTLAGGAVALSTTEAIMDAKLVEENRTLREENEAHKNAEAEAKAARVVDEALAAEEGLSEATKARLREALRGIDDKAKITAAIADEKKYLAEARKDADADAGAPEGAGAQEGDARKATLERLQGVVDEAFGLKPETVTEEQTVPEAAGLKPAGSGAAGGDGGGN